MVEMKNRNEHLDDNGLGWCSFPAQDAEGKPAGFCDCPAYGPQTEEGKRSFDGYVPGLACVTHGGPSLEGVYSGLYVAANKAETDGGFKVEISTDGPAFENDRERYGAAVRRVLRTLHADLWAGLLGGSIKDVQGNVIGAWRYD